MQNTGTTSIETPKHNFKNIKEARNWAKNNIVGTYKNQNTDQYIYIAKNAIDKYLSASSVLKSIDKDIHQSTLKVLPRLIETSLLKEVQLDRDNNYHIIEIQRFYGTIYYEGRTYPVKITVKALRNEGNKAYSYEIVKMQNPTTNKELSGGTS